MILINLKFTVKPELADQWMDAVAQYTADVRSEEGNLFFEWSRSVDDPDVYVLVEAFRDSDAGGQHVQSDHFARALETLPAALVETPQILNAGLPETDWQRMGEMEVPPR